MYYSNMVIISYQTLYGYSKQTNNNNINKLV